MHKLYSIMQCAKQADFATHSLMPVLANTTKISFPNLLPLIFMAVLLKELFSKEIFDIVNNKNTVFHCQLF